jgi:hypothetical protein
MKVATSRNRLAATSAVKLGAANLISVNKQKIGKFFAKHSVVRKNCGAGA